MVLYADILLCWAHECVMKRGVRSCDERSTYIRNFPRSTEAPGVQFNRRPIEATAIYLAKVAQGFGESIGMGVRRIHSMGTTLGPYLARPWVRLRTHA